MKPKPVCPGCGSNKGEFIKGFCRHCYLAQNKLLDIADEIAVEYCKRCSKIKLGGKWQQQNAAALEDFVAKKLRVKQLQNPGISVKLQQVGEDKTKAIISVKGTIDSNAVELNAAAILKPATTTCDSCMKLSGNYYEAKLQLRFSDKSMEKKVRVMQKISSVVNALHEKDSLAVITGKAKARNGFDLLLGSNNAAKQAIAAVKSKFKAKVKKSSKLVGVDKRGKRKFRFTYSIRI